MTAYFRMSEAQERDLSMVSDSLGAIIDMTSIKVDMQITLNAEEVASLLIILRERLPSNKTMQFIVE